MKTVKSFVRVAVLILASIFLVSCGKQTINGVALPEFYGLFAIDGGQLIQIKQGGIPNFSENVSFLLFDKNVAAAEDVTIYSIGLAYATGKGVDTNYIEAVKWYRKSADQGNAKAQRDMGVHYYYGQGVETNYVEAFQWFQKAVIKMTHRHKFGWVWPMNVGKASARILQKLVNGFSKRRSKGMHLLS